MIDWSKQHCGVHQAALSDMLEIMPDIVSILHDFPENPDHFVWDVKVHMLMPNQFPCIPNWHFDNVPRVNNRQDFEAIKPDKPMYLWLSGAPLTEFRKNGKVWSVPAGAWVRFTQEDEHRGTMSNSFCWRGFVRATHKDIAPQRPRGSNPTRRHSQVYLDAANFSW